MSYRAFAAMMDKCAAGWTVKGGLHNRRVYVGAADYWLPGGKKGDRKDEIEIGHLKRLCKHFGIGDCATDHIPQLKMRTKPSE